jgi:hypothetical protein
MIKSIGKLTMALSVATGLLAGSGLCAQNIVDNANASSPTYLIPIGVFPFQDGKEEKLEGAGRKVANLMTAELTMQPEIMLVDRTEIDKVISEQALSISGMANPEYANKVGYLIGARILVTGSVFMLDKQRMCIVAKIIGTETTRVLAEKVDGAEALDAIVRKLSMQIAARIKADGVKLLPVYRTRGDVINAIKMNLGSGAKPKLYVEIKEHHVQAPVVDPAAQTEFISILKDLGFEVVERPEDATVVLKGEGFSETGLRRGELIGVKARLEVKAVDKAGKIIAADRQTAVCVDVVERMAGKEALQNAASLMAVRLVPKLVAK